MWSVSHSPDTIVLMSCSSSTKRPCFGTGVARFELLTNWQSEDSTLPDLLLDVNVFSFLLGGAASFTVKPESTCRPSPLSSTFWCLAFPDTFLDLLLNVFVFCFFLRGAVSVFIVKPESMWSCPLYHLVWHCSFFSSHLPSLQHALHKGFLSPPLVSSWSSTKFIKSPENI